MQNIFIQKFRIKLKGVAKGIQKIHLKQPAKYYLGHNKTNTISNQCRISSANNPIAANHNIIQPHINTSSNYHNNKRKLWLSNRINDGTKLAAKWN